MKKIIILSLIIITVSLFGYNSATYTDATNKALSAGNSTFVIPVTNSTGGKTEVTVHFKVETTVGATSTQTIIKEYQYYDTLSQATYMETISNANDPADNLRAYKIDMITTLKLTNDSYVVLYLDMASFIKNLTGASPLKTPAISLRSGISPNIIAAPGAKGIANFYIDIPGGEIGEISGTITLPVTPPTTKDSFQMIASDGSTGNLIYDPDKTTFTFEYTN